MSVGHDATDEMGIGLVQSEEQGIQLGLWMMVINVPIMPNNTLKADETVLWVFSPFFLPLAWGASSGCPKYRCQLWVSLSLQQTGMIFEEVNH